jgi:hypothetical protein
VVGRRTLNRLASCSSPLAVGELEAVAISTADLQRDEAVRPGSGGTMFSGALAANDDLDAEETPPGSSLMMTASPRPARPCRPLYFSLDAAGLPEESRHRRPAARKVWRRRAGAVGDDAGSHRPALPESVTRGWCSRCSALAELVTLRLSAEFGSFTMNDLPSRPDRSPPPSQRRVESATNADIADWLHWPLLCPLLPSQMFTRVTCRIFDFASRRPVVQGGRIRVAEMR